MFTRRHRTNFIQQQAASTTDYQLNREKQPVNTLLLSLPLNKKGQEKLLGLTERGRWKKIRFRFQNEMRIRSVPVRLWRPSNSRLSTAADGRLPLLSAITSRFLHWHWSVFVWLHPMCRAFHRPERDVFSTLWLLLFTLSCQVAMYMPTD